jgi:hypothetical protein
LRLYPGCNPPGLSFFPMQSGSYVIRVYRRTKKNASARRGYDRVSLNGIVEEAESGERRSFRGIEELWGFLSRPPRAAKRNG